MRVGSLGAWGWLSVALAGCAGHSAAPVSPAAVAPDDRGATAAQALADVSALLAAADGRVQQRSSTPASSLQQFRALQRSLQSEEAAGELNGAADPFTYAPRVGAIREAEARLSALPSESQTLGAARQASALLREERARLQREQARPGALVELTHGLAQALYARGHDDSLDAAGVSAREALLARRLGELEDESVELDALDAGALNDALDPIEPFVNPVGAAGRALTSLRLALGGPHQPPSGSRPLPPLGRPFQASAQAERWQALRLAVSAELHAPAPPSATLQRDADQQWAAEALLRSHSCNVQLPIAPPPERALGCHALEASAENATRLALVAHDLLTLGLWAIALSEQRSEPRRVLTDAPLQAQASPELAARWLRLAGAVPAWALRAGELGAYLAEVPSTERAARARRYLQGGALLPAELELTPQ